MTRGAARSRESGFTLVELLVGLTLVAMLGALMLLGYRAVVPAWQRTEARAAATRSLALAQDTLQRLLSGAYPAVIGEPGERHVDFSGSADQIEFLAPLPQRFGARVIARYRLTSPGDGTLRLNATPELGEGDQPPAASETVLLDGLAGARFSYRGADEPGVAPTWQEDWSGRKTLPDLIRFRLSGRDASAAGWPDITIAPLVTADADCAFDPRDGKCRGL